MFLLENRASLSKNFFGDGHGKHKLIVELEGVRQKMLKLPII